MTEMDKFTLAVGVCAARADAIARLAGIPALMADSGYMERKVALLLDAVATAMAALDALRVSQQCSKGAL